MTRTKKQTHNGDERAALILELFRQLPDNKFSLRHLASASGGASKEGRRETMQIVEQLLATGVIESCPRDKYRLSPAQRPRLEGTVEMLNTGSMFVHVEGMEQQVYIHSRNSLNALDGDRVQLVLTRKARGSNAHEGEITAIVERSRKPYVGIAEVGAHQIFVRADSRRMPMDIYLSKRLYPDVKDGEKVVVRIADWAEGSKSPVGELIERLGMAGNNDTEMHSILAEYELPYRFEPEIEEAAQADFDDGVIDADVVEIPESGSRNHFKFRRPFPAGSDHGRHGVFDDGYGFGEVVAGNIVMVDMDPFRVIFQMRRRIAARPEAGFRQDGSDHGRHRALAIGPGDVDGLIIVLRVAQPFQ